MTGWTYDLFLSPDRLILASLESGSVSAIKVNNVTMISLGSRQGERRPADRPGASVAIISMTSEACFEQDLTGMTEQRHFPNADPVEQQQLHRRRLATYLIRPFSESPLEDWRRFRIQQSSAAEERGDVCFLSDDPNVYRPTLVGGLKMFLQTYGFQIGRRLYPHRWRVRSLPAATT